MTTFMLRPDAESPYDPAASYRVSEHRAKIEADRDKLAPKSRAGRESQIAIAEAYPVCDVPGCADRVQRRGTVLDSAGRPTRGSRPLTLLETGRWCGPHRLLERSMGVPLDHVIMLIKKQDGDCAWCDWNLESAIITPGDKRVGSVRLVYGLIRHPLDYSPPSEPLPPGAETLPAGSMIDWRAGTDVKAVVCATSRRPGCGQIIERLREEPKLIFNMWKTERLIGRRTMEPSVDLINDELLEIEKFRATLEADSAASSTAPAGSRVPVPPPF